MRNILTLNGIVFKVVIAAYTISGIKYSNDFILIPGQWLFPDLLLFPPRLLNFENCAIISKD
ncbi:hypothetical protein HMPREF1146_1003 [Prevotella sp. MSX73]|uniref:Uncharacterized protein n=1 Tax=Segatella buccae ATCC 33574 TaxID=873513 RepID=E6K574_9BACT|nr:hypothetical protein HMPREF0649_01342 [Segatella buccae D17]EFU31320.1 hypothetical protein HMPREF6485_0713 [Segatella buccae ATCC 33574]EJP31187.1 hypothetical protein HMPREF1146_1003 [Prevotella sp. MSX73]